MMVYNLSLTIKNILTQYFETVYILTECSTDDTISTENPESGTEQDKESKEPSQEEISNEDESAEQRGQGKGNLITNKIN